MPRRKPAPTRPPGPASGASPDAPDSGAPEAVLRPQRTSSSDMERALPHPASSEETGVHADRDEQGVPGYLEPRTPDADAPQGPAG